MAVLDATELLQERIRRAPPALIAARIKRARKEFGSHDALVAAMGSCSRSHIIKLEQGKHRPNAALLSLIATTTGRSLDYFLDENAGDAPFQEVA